jgi:hypothetical protein
MELRNLSEEGMVKAVRFATANGYVPAEVTVQRLLPIDYAFSGRFVRSFRQQVRGGDPFASLCRLNFQTKTFTAVVFRKIPIRASLRRRFGESPKSFGIRCSSGTPTRARSVEALAHAMEETRYHYMWITLSPINAVAATGSRTCTHSATAATSRNPTNSRLPGT